ncbi:MAG: hypothetical protein JRJ77_07185 [Deltaproteobacteria bacterium]|nr:hypothetical protein [Deltaproteobacteria bacterium]MBW2339614.1 hypothetical protein [Deltaproteobacteria bacterium]
MEKGKHVPENANFCCFGCMSNGGTLTGVLILEAYRKLDKKKSGLFCTPAIAAGVPKHRKTTEKAKRIIAIDGCFTNTQRRFLKRVALREELFAMPSQELRKNNWFC